MSQYAKAIVAFVISYLATLTALVQAGGNLTNPALYLAALVSAVATGYTTYRVPNTKTIQ